MAKKYINENIPPKQVKYLDASERQAHQMTVIDGRLCDRDGRPISILNKEDLIYVVAPDGKVYFKIRPAQGKFHHSSFLAGGDVLAAGHMTIRDGHLEFLNLRSGHYMARDGVDHDAVLVGLERYFGAMGVDMTNVVRQKR